MDNRTIVCPRCGLQQSSSNMFCTNCGTPLANQNSQGQPQGQSGQTAPNAAGGFGAVAGWQQHDASAQNAGGTQYSIPGQIPVQERKKGGNGPLIAIISIVAALIVAVCAVVGVYFAGGFDGLFNKGSGGGDDGYEVIGGNDDGDKDKETDKRETEKQTESVRVTDKETEKNEDEPAPVENVHFICDFEAYSKGEAKLTGQKDLGNYIRYQFRIPTDAAVQVGGEYVWYHLDSLGFLYGLDEYENDDQTVLGAALSYDGDEDIKGFSDSEKGFDDVVVEIEINLNPDEEYSDIKLFVSKGIGFRDIGDRTTFDRDSAGSEPEVAYVSMNIKGQLYFGYELSDWIPEGYFMETEIYVYGKDGSLLDVEPTVTVDDEDVLQYDPYNGRIIAVGPGTATVTASAGDYYDTYTIDVYPVKDLGNYMEAEPEHVDIPSSGDPFYFTTTLTMNFSTGGDMMSFTVMTPEGIEVSEIGEWNGNSIDITLYIDPEEMDRSFDFVALLCGFVYNAGDGIDYSTDLCSILALYDE